MPMQSSHYRCIVQTFRNLDGYTISLLRLREKHGRLLYARHGTQAARIGHSMLKHGQVCLVHIRVPWHHLSSGSPWRVSGRHRCRRRARRHTRLRRLPLRCSLVSCMPRRWGIRPTQLARVTWLRGAKIFQAQLAARSQLAVCHPQPKPRPAPSARKYLFRIGMQACAM